MLTTINQYPLALRISKFFINLFDHFLRLLRGVKRLDTGMSCIDHRTQDMYIKNLVCERCWTTVFSIEAFVAMRQNPPGDNLWYEGGGGFKYETLRWNELKDVAKRCSFCGLVCNAIAEHSETPPSAEKRFFVTVGMRSVEAYSAPLFEIMAFVVDDGSVVPDSHDYTVFTTEDNEAALHIHARGLTGTVDNYEQVLKCIKTCSGHDLCPQPIQTLLPTRVIDCFDPERPHLVTSDLSTKAFYVALSYVWGESQPYRTTAENIEAYHTLIDPRYIPRTIRNAITVTNGLGLRYLWVDSFCIMQDSEEDKGREIERIRIYFQNAFVTVVAANADRVSEGFLSDVEQVQPVPKWHLEPINLPFRSPDGFLGIMSLHRTYADWPTRNDPVDQRAWCLEERVLSPRRLLFCSHALQYECQRMRINVNGSPLGLVDIYPRLPDCAFTNDPEATLSEAEKKELVNDWDIIVNSYTGRKLTKSKDKLVAFAGVAEKFHQFWGSESQYVAGLWTHQLPEGLLWHVDDSGKEETKDLVYVRNPPPSVYRAPSWSWAAVDDVVQSLRFVPQAPDSTAFCTVKCCEATLKRETNPYGEVTYGLLSLEASTMVVTWNTLQGQSDNVFEISSEMHKERKPVTVATGYLIPDTSEFIERERQEVIMAGVFKGLTTIFGLALVPTSTEGGTSYHRRIGWVRIDIEYWYPEPSRTLHVI
ncbi:hypothetical protein K435DRAFT_759789 [Dendrothele bispora CBS 962.96]|uniref:Heterokaryon incompatibility domain-containing protein n=1 Tax=Dendrothele bispora (strain CBS 962.96) TaxID=1314807 RepID=A0A4S8LP10_DENBC|nr:hypothetical protein K435DRAFT_759789 [Dendrothele bispora CBS 962.96]